MSNLCRALELAGISVQEEPEPPGPLLLGLSHSLAAARLVVSYEQLLQDPAALHNHSAIA